MYRIHHQAKARTDIKNIWQYSCKNYGVKQADIYHDGLIAGMEAIQDNPYIGVPCDYIRSGYRQYKINKHHIFYRLSKQKIHIVRVLHETMQATRNM